MASPKKVAKAKKAAPNRAKTVDTPAKPAPRRNVPPRMAITITDKRHSAEVKLGKHVMPSRISFSATEEQIRTLDAAGINYRKG